MHPQIDRRKNEIKSFVAACIDMYQSTPAVSSRRAISGTLPHPGLQDALFCEKPKTNGQIRTGLSLIPDDLKWETHPSTQVPPYSSFRLFQTLLRNWSSKYPICACTSIMSKPAIMARWRPWPDASTSPLISSVVSGRQSTSGFTNAGTAEQKAGPFRCCDNILPTKTHCQLYGLFWPP